MERIDNESTVKTTVEEKSDREEGVCGDPLEGGGWGGERRKGQSVKRTKKSKDGREGGQGASMMSFNRRRKAKRHKKGKRRTGMERRVRALGKKKVTRGRGIGE